MSIYVNESSKIIVQGITGSAGKFHTQKMLEYGTKIVAGVSPGRGGEKVQGIPVFNTVEEAVRKTQANVSVIYIPAPYASDGILEAANSNIPLVICITEHIPVKDMIRVREYLKDKPTTLIGPNCPGVITPDECKVGIMPGYIHKKGRIGVVSRSGTLTYEAVHQLSQVGLGQSTAVGIGGDPVNGTSFVDVLKLFNEDPETHGVVIIGEIGGNQEEEAAKWINENMRKPVVGFISGVTAPAGKRMGHAGAIISGGKGTASEKIRVMAECGITMATTPSTIGETMRKQMEEQKTH